MNKTAIKNFAIWARNKLRADIILKAGLLGITDKEISNPLPQSTDDLQIFDIGTSQPVRLEGKTAIDQRKSLVAAIRAKNLKHAEAFDAVIEEVAYTWFNRLSISYQILNIFMQLFLIAPIIIPRFICKNIYIEIFNHIYIAYIQLL